MPKLQVVDMKKQPVEEVAALDNVFGAEVKEHLLWEVATNQMANKRQGTSSAKTRSEVCFTGTKMYRQKGTGRARPGSQRSGVRVGGGAIFGPKPRDYSYKTPKKVRKAAVISALSMKAAEGFLVVLDKIVLAQPKTKLFAGMCNALGVKSALFVLETKDEALMRASRNIRGVKALPVEGLNVYDLLRYEHLVLTKTALEQIEQRYGK